MYGCVFKYREINAYVDHASMEIIQITQIPPRPHWFAMVCIDVKRSQSLSRRLLSGTGFRRSYIKGNKRSYTRSVGSFPESGIAPGPAKYIQEEVERADLNDSTSRCRECGYAVDWHLSIYFSAAYRHRYTCKEKKSTATRRCAQGRGMTWRLLKTDVIGVDKTVRIFADKTNFLQYQIGKSDGKLRGGDLH
jgi:hypothetical protein